MRKIVSIMLISALVILGSACSPAQVGVAQFQPAQRAVASCIVKRESGGNPSAISATNDYGLFQINRSAHKRQFERMYGAPFERKALDRMTALVRERATSLKVGMPLVAELDPDEARVEDLAGGDAGELPRHFEGDEAAAHARVESLLAEDDDPDLETAIDDDDDPERRRRLAPCTDIVGTAGEPGDD